jgi:hypothetical protein
MMYLWTDPNVVRAVVDSHRPAPRPRRIVKTARRLPRVELPRLATARPTEAGGA